MSGLRSIPRLGSPKPRSAAKIAPPPATGPRPLPDRGRPTFAPRGPAHLRLGQKRRTGTGGPGVPPADFPGSVPEWVWYWSSARYHRDPPDPRVGPFLGGAAWEFQDPIGPGVTAARDPGESVSDFRYLMPSGASVYIRIEGVHWHLGQGGAVLARDLTSLIHAGQGGDRVARINDTQFMADVTGATAIRLLADVLAGRPPVGQVGAGTVLPARYGDFARGISA